MAERLVAWSAAGAVLATAHSILNWQLLHKPQVDVSSCGGPHQSATQPDVSVLIPARDEAHRIGPTLTSVLTQRDVALEVVVLDDQSSDGTGDVARRTAAGDPRVTVIRGASLPDGWLGKPHACHQLGAVAAGDVLVFLDADVVLDPGALRAAVDVLQRAHLDLLSPYPRQVVAGVGQRLVQPLLQWSWLTLLPLRLAERSAAPTMTAANGQLLLCRTKAYHDAGGHQAVAADVIEDVGLARAFKQAGSRVGMADGTGIAECRMYDTWPELSRGYRKSLWSAFGSPSGAAAVLMLLLGLYVVPPVGLIVGLATGRGRLAGLGAMGYVAGVGGRAFVAARTAGRPVDAWAHPLSILTFGHLMVRSLRDRRAGTLRWKGRAVQ